MPLASTIPGSMYHRRLLLLGVLVILGMLAPLFGLFRWTLLNHESSKAQADSYLVNWLWLPTPRGQILDRHGRILAQDRPSFDIAVDYRVITGQWANTQATRRFRQIPREQRARLTPQERRARIESLVPEYQARLETMWQDFCRLSGIERQELEERKNRIRLEVQAKAADARARRLAKLEEEAAVAAGGAAPKINSRELDRPIAEQESSHVLLNNVSDETAFAFLRVTQDIEAAGEWDQSAPPLPGVVVRDTRSRDYPFEGLDVVVDRTTLPSPLRASTPLTVTVDGVATHLIGWMRHRVYQTDNEGQASRLPDGSLNRAFYIDGESVGTAGIEKSAERELRGLRGIQTRKLDTRETIRTADVESGKDVRLTIDIQLQARLQALFDPAVGFTIVQPWHYKVPDDQLPRGVPVIGDALAGAAVVLEVDTGDILALVSHPSFSHQDRRDDFGALRDDKTFLPLLNRAVSQPYPPGSIVKPLILCAAATAGDYSPGQRIECTGHFYPDKPDILQCWAWKQFHTTHTARLGHDPDGSEAIMGSCNIFFYELGRRLGPRSIVDWYTRFGVGKLAAPRRLGLDLEFTGLLPDPEKIGPTDAALMGIGQGPIAWTPLHAADAYATIARGGVRLAPRIRADAANSPVDLALNQRAVEIALDGLERACTENDGTAHHITFATADGDKKEVTFNVLADGGGVRVWAKSGTADASALLADLDGDGEREIVRDGDHAWCVLLVGDGSGAGNDRPRFAVAVVVDYGGSGGRVAAPIANQVLRALIAEGYLTSTSAPRKDTTASAAP